MKIIIVGAGAVGSIVAERLSRGENDVVLIESDEQSFPIEENDLEARVGVALALEDELVPEAEALVHAQRRRRPVRHPTAMR